MFSLLSTPRPSRAYLALSLFALLWCLFAFSAQAEGITTVSVETIKTSAINDDIMTITVDVNNVTELYGAEFIMKFNPDELQVVDANPSVSGTQVTAGNCTRNEMNINLVENTTGVIRYASMALTHTATRSVPHCTMAQISFQVQPGSTTESTLEFEDVILVGATEQIDAQVPNVVTISTRSAPTAVTLAELGTNSASPSFPLVLLGLTIVAGGSMMWHLSRRKK